MRLLGLPRAAVSLGVTAAAGTVSAAAGTVSAAAGTVSAAAGAAATGVSLARDGARRLPAVPGLVAPEPVAALAARALGQVNGRQVWSQGDRAHIEVRGLRRADAAGLVADLERSLEADPAVRWARVNVPAGRVVVAFEGRAALPRLVDAVRATELRCCSAPPAELDRDAQFATEHPGDPGPAARAAAALAADAVGLAWSIAGSRLRAPALPLELPALIGLVEQHPRLRELVSRPLGRHRAEALLGVGRAVAGSLGQGSTGLALDAVSRLSTIAATRAVRGSWRRAEPELAGDPGRAWAGGVASERTRPLPPGPLDDYTARLGLGLGAAAAPSLVTTGDPRRATSAALAALPKPAVLGPKGFAEQLARELARRGAVIMDGDALRLLDRVDTVVLDGRCLESGALGIGDVSPLTSDFDDELPRRVYEMFRADEPDRIRRGGRWRLAPAAKCPLEPAAAGAADRLRAAGARQVLVLCRDRAPVALVALVPEAAPGADLLARTAAAGPARLVVAGDGATPGIAAADEVVPEARLVAAIRARQERGGAVLVVSARPDALGHADVAVGVSAPDGRPGWGGHVLVGRDLATAALVVAATRAAARVAARSTALARFATGLGAAVALTGRARRLSAYTLRTLDAVSATALASGAWTARALPAQLPAEQPARTRWHALPVAAVLERLDTDPGRGLPEAQARRRAARASRTGAPQAPSLGAVFLDELANPLTPVLAAGAALSAAVGSPLDAGMVAGATAASALVGAVQRRGTERAVADLLRRSQVDARVVRDGRERVRSAGELVCGDVARLRAGDVVPADCRLVTAEGLEVDESSLTGESLPVAKSPDAVISQVLAERSSMLYEGTTVTAGTATAVVVAVGDATEASRGLALASTAAAPRSGVDRRLREITNTTIPVAFGAGGAVVAAGLLRGHPLRESMDAAVGLAVASVPEGLPFLVATAQLAAARRLSQRGALVRSPRSIEALGRVDTLCFDKTGTLTEGSLRMVAVHAGGRTATLADARGEHLEVLAAALRATPDGAGSPLNHFTDRAVVDGCRDRGCTRDAGGQAWRLAELREFQPSRGYSAGLGAVGGRRLLAVKGAPEAVVPLCELTRAERERIDAELTELAGRGYRVLAVAQREAGPGDRLGDGAPPAALRFLGFVALADPVRPSAVSAIRELAGAGVQLVIITGDHPATAAAVGRELGLVNGHRTITGDEIDGMDDAELARVLPEVAVVARGTPTHKTRVVEAFRRIGRTVAMTGDGTNDAPAIRLADVGIALGRRATPAARVAADLVVTDDAMEAILAALAEGRSMWLSVREALAVLVGGNLGEIAFTVLGALATGRSPLSTRQLLLVNLLTDLAPAMAIAVQPPPPSAHEHLLADGPDATLGETLTRDIAVRAGATTFGAGLGWTLARATGRRRRADTVGLVSLIGAQLGQSLVAGRGKPAVLAAGIGSTGVLAGLVQTPGVSQFFGCTPLGPVGWTIAGLSAGAATVASVVAPSLVERVSVPPERVLPDWARGTISSMRSSGEQLQSALEEMW